MDIRRDNDEMELQEQAPDYVRMNDPVLKKMAGYIETWKRTEDRRYLFLSCYATMTGNMVKAIEAGEFKDPVWVRRLLERFADYYFEGLERCECGAPDRPRVWEYSNRITLQCDLHVMQYLLLGINAHINYDLVLTLREILQDEWQDATEEIRSMRRQDHLHVNEIIADTVDVVQEQIIEKQSPVMGVVDKLMGRVDEYLLSRLISNWRNDVWDEAMYMLDIRNPDHLEHQRQQLEEKVLQLAERIMLK